MDEQLKKLIDRYLAADTYKKASTAKGLITRRINEMAKVYGISETRNKVIIACSNNPELSFFVKRVFPFSDLYQEGNRIFGWWNPEVQVQAEALPLTRDEFQDAYVVSYSDENRGFHVAQPLPLRFFSYPSTTKVEVKTADLIFFAKYGYAKAWELQWSYENEAQQKDYIVNCSLTSYGFWAAYKWWAGCQWWYYERHPEWFTDMDWWGISTADKPLPKESDAVLGGRKEIWQAFQIFMNESA